MSKPTGSAVVLVSFAIAIASAVGLAIVYGLGGNTRLEGALLAAALGGLGVGIVSMAKVWLPDGLDTEDRGQLKSSEQDQPEGEAVAVADDESPTGKRNALRLMFAGLAALGAAMIFPIQSLGRRPSSGLRSTAFQSGGRVVTADGNPVRADSIPIGGEFTVFPEGHTLDADAPAVLVRVEARLLSLPADRMAWTVDGLVAYSKVCTHAGCPVGLFQAESGLLLCPCHQSTFDVLDGANPTFGPATRPLPQLPIAVDDEGYVVAIGDYPEPVGPGFWDRQ